MDDQLATWDQREWLSLPGGWAAERTEEEVVAEEDLFLTLFSTLVRRVSLTLGKWSDVPFVVSRTNMLLGVERISAVFTDSTKMTRGRLY